MKPGKIDLRDSLPWNLAAATGLISTVLAILLSGAINPATGYVCCSLAVGMPVFNWWYSKHTQAFVIRGRGDDDPTE